MAELESTNTKIKIYILGLIVYFIKAMEENNIKISFISVYQEEAVEKRNFKNPFTLP